jgi:succinate dehydrogenase / fumarate reductase cytochrome b subunit
MSRPASPARPLSPHLQVYRPQITSVLSILHRVTGIALACGAFVVAAALLSAAAGEGPFVAFHALFSTLLGRAVLGGWLFALVFHLLTGIRHLVLDCGIGFDIKHVHASGWIVVIAAVALTAYFWCAAAGGLT